MNDFTKEELEDLLSCCYGGMHNNHPVEDWKEALQIKIQSMIDNYCEHEREVECYNCMCSVTCTKEKFLQCEECLKKCEHEWKEILTGPDENGDWNFLFSGCRKCGLISNEKK